MNKRKIGIIAGVLCLLAVAGFFVVKMQFESNIRGTIESTLAGLPQPLAAKAEEIDVSFSDKSVTLTNLKVTYTYSLKKGDSEETIPMDYTFDRITAKGINMDGFKEGAGTQKLVDSLVFVNAKFMSPLAQSHVGLYTFDNITGDFQQLYTEFAKALPVMMAANAKPEFAERQAEQRKLMDALAGILKAYETVHIDKSTFEDYQYAIDFEGTKVDVHFASGQSLDASMRKMGPVVLKNMTVKTKDVEVGKLDSLSMDEIILPSFAEFFKVLGQDAMPSRHILQGLLKGQTFVLKNLRMKNLETRHPLFKDTPFFTLADVDFSYTAETAHTIDFSFSNLNLPKSVLLRQSRLPAQTMAALPDVITLEGVMQQSATPKDEGAYDAECKKIFLKGTGLGEGTLSFAISDLNFMAVMMGMPSKAALKNFDLSLRDAGFSDVAFAINGLYSGKSGEEARAEEVASIREELEEDPDVMGKEIIAGFADFLEKSGNTLRIKVAPASPISLEDAHKALLSNPETLGLSVTVTPNK